MQPILCNYFKAGLLRRPGRAAIARLAGWNDSKRTGKATSIILWKGWQRLADLVLGQASARLFLTGRSWL